MPKQIFKWQNNPQHTRREKKKRRSETTKVFAKKPQNEVIIRYKSRVISFELSCIYCVYFRKCVHCMMATVIFHSASQGARQRRQQQWEQQRVGLGADDICKSDCTNNLLEYLRTTTCHCGWHFVQPNMKRTYNYECIWFYFSTKNETRIMWLFRF